MPRPYEEILASARTELARGRPRAALREMEKARGELVASADVKGLSVLLELARGVRTLAPVDGSARERLLAATEQNIESLSSGAITATAEAPPGPVGPFEMGTQFVPFGSVTTEQILAPARAEIERRETGHALRSLEKARRKLLERADTAGLGELLELAQRLPTSKPRHEQAQRRLIDATQQNIRYLGRRTALKTGQEWSDPFAAAKPKTRLPSLPPMTRREKLIAAAIVVVLAGGITTWALLARAPQRVAHAVKCPTGEQGGPTWSPDGKEIAFAKNGECGTQIMVMPAAGGPLRTVTSRYGVLPDWSPDGSEILYRSRSGFSVVPAEGGESRLLQSDDGNMGASWSPDSQRIAFVHGLAGNKEFGYHSTMYTMDAKGGNVHRLLGHSCNPRTPDWSPTGRYLVFACEDGVYDMPSKGGLREHIVAVDFSIFPVSVSVTPDAHSLAFGWDGVETVPTSGARDPIVFTRVFNPRKATIDVSWSPDGRRLAFSVTGSGIDDGLYVIDRDGSHRRRLVRF